MATQSLPAQELTVESAESRRKLLIGIFIGVAFLYWAGLYLYGSTLAINVQAKVNNLAVVGSILWMYGLWQIIVRLPMGIGVDWMGRRNGKFPGGCIGGPLQRQSALCGLLHPVGAGHLAYVCYYCRCYSDHRPAGHPPVPVTVKRFAVFIRYRA